jgi:hypothetical protein
MADHGVVWIGLCVPSSNELGNFGEWRHGRGPVAGVGGEFVVPALKVLMNAWPDAAVCSQASCFTPRIGCRRDLSRP